MIDRRVRTASREPLEHAIRQYLARRQDQAMALADRGADRKTGAGTGPGWRGPDPRVAGAVAGGVAVIFALLALVALTVRVIG